MASAGPNSPSTGADDASIGTVAWSNPGNILASDNTRATVNLASGNVSHYLKGTGFGFSIPSTAIIDGILVEWERVSNLLPTTIKDQSVKIVKGGTISGDEKADTSVFWPTTEAYKSYGGSAVLWGLSWAASDINASNFGAVIAAVASGGADQALVDHVRITVYYTDLIAKSDSDSGAGSETESVLVTLVLSDADSGAGAEAEALATFDVTPTVRDLGRLTLHSGALAPVGHSGALGKLTAHSGDLGRIGGQ